MTKTVMIVEDNELNMKLFRDLLVAHGYDTVQTRSGLEAMDLARAHKPDLILMDVVMPELNGFQATRKLTKDPELGSIPVILVTTKDQETDKVWGERQGAAGYIVKPPQEAELASMIQRVLG